ncbi:hypothetical protein KIW84_015066 [Lathyrus oleraceus]|uniref:Uncharacterized protein n=1 Tax=Pisum sativum TaxID=3888 RepID=A0A9D5BPB0_PEA|nr:hypothetical protein KIW84_015066 [Pisum sativum]
MVYEKSYIQKLLQTCFHNLFSSICGNRPEMEDVIAVKPQLLQVPLQMLMDDDKHINENSKHSPAFFSDYDGHRGFQEDGRKVLFNCFQKVDDEVGGTGAGSSRSNGGGSESNIEPIAHATVGSNNISLKKK